MSGFGELTQSRRVLVLFILLVLVVFFMQGLQISPVSAIQQFKLSVTPSMSVLKLGDCLYFRGQLTDQRGKGVPNVQVYIYDPIKEQCLKGPKTDNNGRFIYYVDQACPVTFNNKAGIFEYKFYALSATATVRVQVNPIPAPNYQEVRVTNSGTDKYSVTLFADGVRKGTWTIAPREKKVLWQTSDGKSHSISITYKNLRTNKQFNIDVSTSTSYSIPNTCTTINPTYARYTVNVKNIITNKETKTESYTFTGTMYNLYKTYINREYGYGANAVIIDTKAEAGMNFDAGAAAYLGCKTFVGLKASCTIGCEGGVGLKYGFCIGWCPPVEPWVILGCGLRCSVSAAELKCGTSVSVQAQATYK